MSSALQNRLVGTIILVAIAVIFLPDLLDGKKESTRNLFVELPKKPPIQEVRTPENFNTQQVKEAATRKVEVLSETPIDQQFEQPTSTNTTESSQGQTPEQAKEQELAVQETPKQAPEKSTSSLAQQTIVEQDPEKLLASAGWVVQLGSFRHQRNVQELLNRLDKAGYRAFSRPVKTKSGTLTKVFVGPDLDKENLEQALSHLKELTKLQGRVTPFTVQ
ncbi:SPOR domain-containing protein [Paraglaciecola aestuariivivens]